MPEKAIASTTTASDDIDMSNEIGNAQILNNLSEAFSIDGLFDNLGDEAAWEGEALEEDIAEDGPAWEAEEQPINLE